MSDNLWNIKRRLTGCEGTLTSVVNSVERLTERIIETSTTVERVVSTGQNTATGSSAGSVQPDNVTTVVDESNGIISVKPATPTTIGAVQPDNDTTTVDANGKISVVSSKFATQEALNNLRATISSNKLLNAVFDITGSTMTTTLATTTNGVTEYKRCKAERYTVILPINTAYTKTFAISNSTDYLHRGDVVRVSVDSVVYGTIDYYHTIALKLETVTCRFSNDITKTVVLKGESHDQDGTANYGCKAFSVTTTDIPCTVNVFAIHVHGSKDVDMFSTADLVDSLDNASDTTAFNASFVKDNFRSKSDLNYHKEDGTDTTIALMTDIGDAITLKTAIDATASDTNALSSKCVIDNFLTKTDADTTYQKKVDGTKDTSIEISFVNDDSTEALVGISDGGTKTYYKSNIAYYTYNLNNSSQVETLSGTAISHDDILYITCAGGDSLGNVEYFHIVDKTIPTLTIAFPKTTDGKTITFTHIAYTNNNTTTYACTKYSIATTAANVVVKVYVVKRAAATKLNLTQTVPVVDSADEASDSNTFSAQYVKDNFVTNDALETKLSSEIRDAKAIDMSKYRLRDDLSFNTSTTGTPLTIWTTNKNGKTYYTLTKDGVRAQCIIHLIVRGNNCRIDWNQSNASDATATYWRDEFAQAQYVMYYYKADASILIKELTAGTGSAEGAEVEFKDIAIVSATTSYTETKSDIVLTQSAADAKYATIATLNEVLAGQGYPPDVTYTDASRTHAYASTNIDGVSQRLYCDVGKQTVTANNNSKDVDLTSTDTQCLRDNDIINVYCNGSTFGTIDYYHRIENTVPTLTINFPNDDTKHVKLTPVTVEANNSRGYICKKFSLSTNVAFNVDIVTYIVYTHGGKELVPGVSVQTSLPTTPTDTDVLSSKCIDDNFLKKAVIQTTVPTTPADTDVLSSKCVDDTYLKKAVIQTTVPTTPSDTDVLSSKCIDDNFVKKSDAQTTYIPRTMIQQPDVVQYDSTTRYKVENGSSGTAYLYTITPDTTTRTSYSAYVRYNAEAFTANQCKETNPNGNSNLYFYTREFLWLYAKSDTYGVLDVVRVLRDYPVGSFLNATYTFPSDSSKKIVLSGGGYNTGLCVATKISVTPNTPCKITLISLRDPGSSTIISSALSTALSDASANKAYSASVVSDNFVKTSNLKTAVESSDTTVLSSKCVSDNFVKTSNLKTAVESSDTTVLSSKCVSDNFVKTSNLKTAVESSDTTVLSSKCVSDNFVKTSNLKTAVESSDTTILSSKCVSDNFVKTSAIQTTVPTTPSDTDVLSSKCVSDSFLTKTDASNTYRKKDFTSNVSYDIEFMLGDSAKKALVSICKTGLRTYHEAESKQFLRSITSSQTYDLATDWPEYVIKNDDLLVVGFITDAVTNLRNMHLHVVKETIPVITVPSPLLDGKSITFTPVTVTYNNSTLYTCSKFSIESNTAAAVKACVIIIKLSTATFFNATNTLNSQVTKDNVVGKDDIVTSSACVAINKIPIELAKFTEVRANPIPTYDSAQNGYRIESEFLKVTISHGEFGYNYTLVFDASIPKTSLFTHAMTSNRCILNITGDDYAVIDFPYLRFLTVTSTACTVCSINGITSLTYFVQDPVVRKSEADTTYLNKDKVVTFSDHVNVNGNAVMKASFKEVACTTLPAEAVTNFTTDCDYCKVSFKIGTNPYSVTLDESTITSGVVLSNGSIHFKQQPCVKVTGNYYMIVDDKVLRLFQISGVTPAPASFTITSLTKLVLDTGNSTKDDMTQGSAYVETDPKNPLPLAYDSSNKRYTIEHEYLKISFTYGSPQVTYADITIDENAPILPISDEGHRFYNKHSVNFVGNNYIITYGTYLEFVTITTNAIDVIDKSLITITSLKYIVYDPAVRKSEVDAVVKDISMLEHNLDDITPHRELTFEYSFTNVSPDASSYDRYCVEFNDRIFNVISATVKLGDKTTNAMLSTLASLQYNCTSTNERFVKLLSMDYYVHLILPDSNVPNGSFNVDLVSITNQTTLAYHKFELIRITFEISDAVLGKNTLATNLSPFANKDIITVQCAIDNFANRQSIAKSLISQNDVDTISSKCIVDNFRQREDLDYTFPARTDTVYTTITPTKVEPTKIHFTRTPCTIIGEYEVYETLHWYRFEATFTASTDEIWTCNMPNNVIAYLTDTSFYIKYHGSILNLRNCAVSTQSQVTKPAVEDRLVLASELLDGTLKQKQDEENLLSNWADGYDTYALEHALKSGVKRFPCTIVCEVESYGEYTITFDDIYDRLDAVQYIIATLLIMACWDKNGSLNIGYLKPVMKKYKILSCTCINKSRVLTEDDADNKYASKYDTMKRERIMTVEECSGIESLEITFDYKGVEYTRILDKHSYTSNSRGSRFKDNQFLMQHFNAPYKFEMLTVPAEGEMIIEDITPKSIYRLTPANTLVPADKADTYAHLHREPWTIKDRNVIPFFLCEIVINYRDKLYTRIAHDDLPLLEGCKAIHISGSNYLVHNDTTWVSKTVQLNGEISNINTTIVSISRLLDREYYVRRYVAPLYTESMPTISNISEDTTSYDRYVVGINLPVHTIFAIIIKDGALDKQRAFAKFGIADSNIAGPYIFPSKYDHCAHVINNIWLHLNANSRAGSSVDLVQVDSSTSITYLKFNISIAGTVTHIDMPLGEQSINESIPAEVTARGCNTLNTSCIVNNFVGTSSIKNSLGAAADFEVYSAKFTKNNFRQREDLDYSFPARTITEYTPLTPTSVTGTSLVFNRVPCMISGEYNFYQQWFKFDLTFAGTDAKPWQQGLYGSCTAKLDETCFHIQNKNGDDVSIRNCTVDAITETTKPAINDKLALKSDIDFSVEVSMNSLTSALVAMTQNGFKTYSKCTDISRTHKIIQSGADATETYTTQKINLTDVILITADDDMLGNILETRFLIDFSTIRVTFSNDSTKYIEVQFTEHAGTECTKITVVTNHTADIGVLILVLHMLSAERIDLTTVGSGEDVSEMGYSANVSFNDDYTRAFVTVSMSNCSKQYCYYGIAKISKTIRDDSSAIIDLTTQPMRGGDIIVIQSSSNSGIVTKVIPVFSMASSIVLPFSNDSAKHVEIQFTDVDDITCTKLTIATNHDSDVDVEMYILFTENSEELDFTNVYANGASKLLTYPFHCDHTHIVNISDDTTQYDRYRIDVPIAKESLTCRIIFNGEFYYRDFNLNRISNRAGAFTFGSEDDYCERLVDNFYLHFNIKARTLDVIQVVSAGAILYHKFGYELIRGMAHDAVVGRLSAMRESVPIEAVVEYTDHVNICNHKVPILNFKHVVDMSFPTTPVTEYDLGCNYCWADITIDENEYNVILDNITSGILRNQQFRYFGMPLVRISENMFALIEDRRLKVIKCNNVGTYSACEFTITSLTKLVPDEYVTASELVSTRPTYPFHSNNTRIVNVSTDTTQYDRYRIDVPMVKGTLTCRIIFGQTPYCITFDLNRTANIAGDYTFASDDDYCESLKIDNYYLHFNFKDRTLDVIRDISATEIIYAKFSYELIRGEAYDTVAGQMSTYIAGVPSNAISDYSDHFNFAGRVFPKLKFNRVIDRSHPTTPITQYNLGCDYCMACVRVEGNDYTAHLDNASTDTRLDYVGMPLVRISEDMFALIENGCLKVVKQIDWCEYRACEFTITSLTKLIPDEYVTASAIDDSAHTNNADLKHMWANGYGNAGPYQDLKPGVKRFPCKLQCTTADDNIFNMVFTSFDNAFIAKYVKTISTDKYEYLWYPTGRLVCRMNNSTMLFSITSCTALSAAEYLTEAVAEERYVSKYDFMKRVPCDVVDFDFSTADWASDIYEVTFNYDGVEYTKILDPKLTTDSVASVVRIEAIEACARISDNIILFVFMDRCYIGIFDGNTLAEDVQVELTKLSKLVPQALSSGSGGVTIQTSIPTTPSDTDVLSSKCIMDNFVKKSDAGGSAAVGNTRAYDDLTFKNIDYLYKWADGYNTFADTHWLKSGVSRFQCSLTIALEDGTAMTGQFKEFRDDCDTADILTVNENRYIIWWREGNNIQVRYYSGGYLKFKITACTNLYDSEFLTDARANEKYVSKYDLMKRVPYTHDEFKASPFFPCELTCSYEGQTYKRIATADGVQFESYPSVHVVGNQYMSYFGSDFGWRPRQLDSDGIGPGSATLVSIAKLLPPDNTTANGSSADIALCTHDILQCRLNADLAYNTFTGTNLSVTRKMHNSKAYHVILDKNGSRQQCTLRVCVKGEMFDKRWDDTATNGSNANAEYWYDGFAMWKYDMYYYKDGRIVVRALASGAGSAATEVAYEDVSIAYAVANYNLTKSDTLATQHWCETTFTKKPQSQTITHYSPYEGDLDKNIIGKPVFMTGNVFKRTADDKWIPSTSADTTDCICSVCSNGTYKEYVGIVTSIDEANHSLTFASHGDYLFKVNDSSKYHIGDTVLFDGSVVGDDDAITNRISKSTVGRVSAIIDSAHVAVFKD